MEKCNETPVKVEKMERTTPAFAPAHEQDHAMKPSCHSQALLAGPPHLPYPKPQPSGEEESARPPRAAVSETAHDAIDPTLRKMRRVDWRWAAAKGFLDKETNQWNEAMGGLEGYLRQRTDRVLARCSPPPPTPPLAILTFPARPTPADRCDTRCRLLSQPESVPSAANVLRAQRDGGPPTHGRQRPASAPGTAAPHATPCARARDRGSLPLAEAAPRRPVQGRHRVPRPSARLGGQARRRPGRAARGGA